MPIVTIEQHLLDQQRGFPQATGEFTSLMYDIALAAKMIVRETTRAGLVDILGAAGSTNVQGEEQQKLDIYAHNMLVRLLARTGRLCIMGSEEEPDPIVVPEQYERGHYAILFDPLDGSSNILFNIAVGTIFSVYRRVSPDDGQPGTLADLLQPGYKQVAAGYIIYSSSTMLVYTAGNGVFGFTLDPTLGEFLLSHENIRFPDKPKYYAINHGYTPYWSAGIRRYVERLTGVDPDHPQKPLSHRYIGSMVSDFHRVMMAGGIFLYPADTRNPDLPHGKLRLCYECAPIAFLTEQAGGMASDGVGRVLDITPVGLHQRIPFFAGNTELVRQVEAYIAEYDGDWVERYQAHMAGN